jgi:hypothetical protein
MSTPQSTAPDLRSRGLLLPLLVLVLLAGLPIAVWLDLSNLSDAALRRQAGDLNSVITSVRGYYASNVVGRVLESPGSTQVVHNYETIPGAIPIPATLSIELGRVLNQQQQDIRYRFVSDYPFEHRTPHLLDQFERRALFCAARRSEPAAHRRLPVDPYRPRPPGNARDHGGDLRQLSQHASGESQARLEGR